MTTSEDSYPHEEPLPGNVALHPARAGMDLPVSDILRCAFNADLEEIVVIGVRKDGREFVSTSMADCALAIYFMQRGMHYLNLYMDELQDDLRAEATKNPQGED